MQKAGIELKNLREQAGLSAGQIAERTKFKLEKIEALESGDFEHLPQGIYLDGIVRAYARELGLDPEPLVEHVRLERGKMPGDSPIPFEEPVLFERPAAPAETAVAPHVAEHSARPRSSHAVAMLALVALLGWGAYFYEATRAVDRDTSGKSYIILPGQVAPNAEPIAFTESELADDQEPSEPEPVIQAARKPKVPIARPRARQRRAIEQAPSPSPTPTQTASLSPDDVTGTWKIATRVESSSLASYSGLLLGYEMQLEQNGDRVTGIGRKIIENGKGIDSRGQTPITITGVVDGDRLTLTFLEGGARRSSQGTFMLLRDADGILRGRFKSDAARSAGTVEARRAL